MLLVRIPQTVCFALTATMNVRFSSFSVFKMGDKVKVTVVHSVSPSSSSSSSSSSPSSPSPDRNLVVIDVLSLMQAKDQNVLSSSKVYVHIHTQLIDMY